MADGGSIEYALVLRASRGDSKAFERLYREHSAKVYGLALRLTRDVALAEDTVQETFLRAWRALDRFESRSRVATWLHRIAVNVVLERRRKRSTSLEVVAEPDTLVDETFVFDTPLEERELEDAIAALPEGARDVLTLCGIYGYQHGEAATMLGIAEGTCKAQLHRARALLKDRLNLGDRP